VEHSARIAISGSQLDVLVVVESIAHQVLAVVSSEDPKVEVRRQLEHTEAQDSHQDTTDCPDLPTYSARLPALHAVVAHGDVPGRLDGGSDTADIQTNATALPRFTAIHYATRRGCGVLESDERRDGADSGGIDEELH